MMAQESNKSWDGNYVQKRNYNFCKQEIICKKNEALKGKVSNHVSYDKSMFLTKKKKEAPYGLSRVCIRKCKVSHQNHRTNHYITNFTVCCEASMVLMCVRVCFTGRTRSVSASVCGGRIEGGGVCLEKDGGGWSLWPHKGVLEGPARRPTRVRVTGLHLLRPAES